MNEDRGIINQKTPSSFFDWGFATDVGKLRKMNQDFFAVSDSLFIVADGMGGHRGGEVASEIATRKVFEKQKYEKVQGFRDQIMMANTEVRKEAAINSEREGMGTTLCGITLLEPSEGTPTKLAVANIGDSRIYLLSQGSFSQITKDHSLVEEMRREGKITASEAESHPHKNIITRALGIDIEAKVDCWEIPTNKNDRFLLCTDGLSNEVPDAEIMRTLETIENPQEAAQLLADLANLNGGNDNVTVVIVDVRQGEEATNPSIISSIPISMTPLTTDNSSSTRDHDIAKASTKESEWKATPENIRKLLATALVMLVIIGLFIGRYARDNYFVGFEQIGDTSIENSQILIYQGRTNSILWFDPTVEERRPILGRDLDEKIITEIQEKPQFETLQDAIQYLDALQEEIAKE